MLNNTISISKTIFLGIILFAMAGFWGPMRNGDSKAPIIKTIEWGKIVVVQNNNEYQYRDAKIWPEKSKEWNWSETGTHHVPGVQIADIKEFINQVDVVIITRGMNLDLQVAPETIDYLKKTKKEYHIGQTKDMVNLYNKLVKEGRKVGGVFHSTC